MIRRPSNHHPKFLDRAAEAVNHGLPCGRWPEDRHDDHEDQSEGQECQRKRCGGAARNSRDDGDHQRHRSGIRLMSEDLLREGPLPVVGGSLLAQGAVAFWRLANAVFASACAVLRPDYDLLGDVMSAEITRSIKRNTPSNVSRL